MNPPRILHLDIDAFFAAVEVRLNPALRGKPVIVGGLAHERGVVCTASYEARKFGVHSGMALRTAAKKCPQGIFLRGRYHIYSDISHRFFVCLRRFSPLVEAVSVDEAYVDLGGSRYLGASVYQLAERIKREAEREIGLNVSAGLGGSRLGAKLATEAAKPGGFFWLLHETEFISGLAVEKIPGIGPQTAFMLQGLGVRRMRDLQRRYFSLWKRVCGDSFQAALSASGSGASAPGRREPETRSFSRETTFPEDIAERGMLLAHLAYLVDRLAVHLQEEKVYAGRIEVKVRFSDFTTFTRRSRLVFPTYSHVQLWRTARDLLNGLLKGKERPLRLVGVKVEDLVEGRGLLPFVCLRDEQLSEGVSRAKARFGFASVFTGRELLLESLYPVEREGLVLKTASLTK